MGEVKVETPNKDRKSNLFILYRVDPASPKRLRIEEELSFEDIPVEEEERLSKWEEIWYRTTHIFREKKY